MRTDAEFIAKMPRPAVYAAVTRVLTDMYPKRRSAGVLAVLIFLTCQSLYSTNGICVGHSELTARFGVSRRILVYRLKEWRNDRRLLDRHVRGRKGSHVTWWAAPNALVKAIAAELRKKPKRHALRKPKLANASQTQRANLAQVAAPGSRTAGGWSREVGSVRVGDAAGKKESIPETDITVKQVETTQDGGSRAWAEYKAEQERNRLAAKIARARAR